ncbi:MAG: hypothetical protein P8K68_05775 [Algibacter sp.]|uniref:hypothetical protein n=1 Tax=Algibacter sp. TaxID=1872428 RepID=UPI002637A50E|nr:hypothetical protein [Algibacter sp.]MDG1731287.1 hypothetical protein [Algibacter sp.]MDG2178285.1 hypothetical protein [Algibacter sp.]
MKKLSLKNLKLETTDVLRRSQLKTVFGGYGGYGGGGSVECRCKNSNTGAAWFDGVSSCDVCTSSWCDNQVPPGKTWTSLICTGPLGGGGYGY